jgi:hypothetical protein
MSAEIDNEHTVPEMQEEWRTFGVAQGFPDAGPWVAYKSE